MFREMRRNRQVLCENDVKKILFEGTSGVLSLQGDDGYPYAVPLNYVYTDEVIYFHCAKCGYKIDCIKRNPKVCFSITELEKILPEKFTTLYKSVTVFGKAEIINGEQEKFEAAEKLGKKYSPDESEESLREEIDRFSSSLCIVKITPEHITGKQCIEFLKETHAE